MILAMSCICILGSIVWCHHMFTVGIESDTRAYFTANTLIISLPTGSKMFNWLCTYLSCYGSFLHVKSSVILFVIIFIEMFIIGGSTGVILGSSSIDLCLHDTYYVVTHFHVVLSLGTLIGLL